jgi:oligo-1,6-glucosidase/alpha-glucosidase
MNENIPWWQKTTIYQIYPRSYKDSNHDGIGDLRGIKSKLDYIKDLGFETIWISPFFSSPQGDWGYDISDYYNVSPEYGDKNDVRDLIKEIHQRDMRLLLDLVLNHTSDQHPWFLESRSNRDNLKRDWYIWKDGDGRRPPNNWKAIPGGSGWHYDQTTDQWYYASFLPFQPDLNFRNPAVKEAMFDVVRYWLDQGVDGFRLDIFHAIYKDEAFRDNPFSFRFPPDENYSVGYFQKWKYNLNQEETFKMAKELRTLVDEHSPGSLLLGELFGDDETIKKYLGEQMDGLNLVFLWDLLDIKVDAKYLMNIILHNERHYPSPYTPVYVFGNHDVKRSISKLANDARIAKIMALFQFTLRGVPVTYYGEEIGMEDGDFPVKNGKDPISQRYSWIPEFIINLLDVYMNRDGCRAPMQWDASDNASFCDKDVEPWLPVHENYKKVNVETESVDDDSILNIYKGILLMRRENKALQEGTLELLQGPEINENLLVYKRQLGTEIALVLINFADSTCTFKNATTCDQTLLAVGFDGPGEVINITMPPYSGLVLCN